MHFQQDFRRFVLILVSGTDDDTPSVKGCFWLGYAVFGSIAWVGLIVKRILILKNLPLCFIFFCFFNGIFKHFIAMIIQEKTLTDSN